MRNPQQSHAHHYVPRWYQKRFLKSGQTNFFLLDLQPEEFPIPGGSHRRRDVLYPRGPEVCFYEDDLYALRFEGVTTDIMERKFFGAIDSAGLKAVNFFAEYSGVAKDTPEMCGVLIAYMGAQRFRTPRGLDEIRQRASWTDGGKNAAVLALGEVSWSYGTMWQEGVWEIVRARNSPTKFVVSDSPVTFYCKTVFPSEWQNPNDVSLKYSGTRTIFPLSLDSCLIITHLQLTRNPWNTPSEPRENARYYDRPVPKHVGDIQFGRELEEDEVLRLNHILKRRALRYVAASEKDWLFPERRVSVTDWKNIDDDWFLFPHLWKIPFTAMFSAGWEDGTVWGADEYGRRPGNLQFDDKKRRGREHITAEAGKRDWAVKRLGKSRAHVDEHRHDGVGDKVMEQFLKEEGLNPSEEPSEDEAVISRRPVQPQGSAARSKARHGAS
jgi:hypothetical protein